MWTLAHDQLCSEKPELLDEEEQVIDVVNYREFVNTLHPMINGIEGDSRTEENIKNRDELLLKFATQGNPGSKFKNQFEKMNKAILLPKAVAEELGVEDREEEEVKEETPKEVPAEGEAEEEEKEEAPVEGEG